MTVFQSLHGIRFMKNGYWAAASLGCRVQAADESESPLLQLTGAWWGPVSVNSPEYGITQISVSVCYATINNHGRYGSNHFA